MLLTLPWPFHQTKTIILNIAWCVLQTKVIEERLHVSNMGAGNGLLFSLPMICLFTEQSPVKY